MSNLFKIIAGALRTKLLKESTEKFRVGELDFVGSEKKLRDSIKKDYKALDKWLEEKKVEFIRVEEELDISIETDQEPNKPVGLNGHDYYSYNSNTYAQDIDAEDFEIEYYVEGSDEPISLWYSDFEDEDGKAAYEFKQVILDLASEDLIG